MVPLLADHGLTVRKDLVSFMMGRTVRPETFRGAALHFLKQLLG